MTRKQEFINQFVANYTASYYASHLADDIIDKESETNFVANMSIKTAENVWNTLNEKEFFGTLEENSVEVEALVKPSVYRVSSHKRKYGSNPIVMVTLDSNGKEQEDIVCLLPIAKKVGDELAERIVKLLNQ